MPAPRDYPHLPSPLEAQLHAIEPTHDGLMEYFPCMVLLASGEQFDCVYIAEAKSFIRFWGAWPDEDPGKKAISIEEVVQIHPSPSRLPVRFAREMYAVGESAMGGCIFTLYFADGTRLAYGTGNLIDFVELPQGKSIYDVIALRPNEGEAEQTMTTRQYYWCLFAAQPRQNFMQRLVHALRFR
jgi:hypothetical protein